MAAASSKSPPRESLYLDPATADGDGNCFDPESPAFRALAESASASTEVAASSMASDLEELRRLMRRYYPGWAELLAVPDFDVEAFFDERIRALRAPGAARVRPALEAGEVMTTLRAHNPDTHLGAWYAGSNASDIYEYQAPAPATLTHEALSSCTFEPPSEVLPETLQLVPMLSVANGSLSTLLTVSARADVTALRATCKGSRRLCGAVLHRSGRERDVSPTNGRLSATPPSFGSGASRVKVATSTSSKRSRATTRSMRRKASSSSTFAATVAGTTST